MFEDDEVDVDADFGEVESKVVWIENTADGTPEMPYLKIVFDPSGSIDYVMGLKKLKVEYMKDVLIGAAQMVGV